MTKAQSRIGEEVMIYQKDRSIYRGVLVVDTNLYVRLRIQTNDVLSIPKEEIRRLNYVADHDIQKDGKGHKIIGNVLFSPQFTDDIDLIVYGKDGSVYNGRMLEDTDDNLNIEVLENYTIILQKDWIKKIKRRDDYLYFRNGRTHKTKGYFLGAHIGASIPTLPDSEEDNYSRHFQLLFGRQFSSNLSLGINLGFAIADIQFRGIWATKAYLAPSLYGRYYLSDGGLRPFTYSQVGYGFGLGLEELETVSLNPQNGFTTQNGIGIHIASKLRTKLLLSIGHYLQRAKGTNLFFDTFNNEVRIDYKYWISRPIIKLGIEFN